MLPCKPDRLSVGVYFRRCGTCPISMRLGNSESIWPLGTRFADGSRKGGRMLVCQNSTRGPPRYTSQPMIAIRQKKKKNKKKKKKKRKTIHTGPGSAVFDEIQPLPTTFPKFTLERSGLGKLLPANMRSSGYQGFRARALFDSNLSNSKASGALSVKRKVRGLLHRNIYSLALWSEAGVDLAAPYARHSRGTVRSRSISASQAARGYAPLLSTPAPNLAVQQSGGAALQFFNGGAPITARYRRSNRLSRRAQMGRRVSSPGNFGR